MQAVIAIPDLSILGNYGDVEKVLTREIAGVPLLIRVIATARRAGADSLVVIWPPDIDQSIWNRCTASPLLQGLQVWRLVQPFDPRQTDSWSAIATLLERQFLWLPWNWVTHKRYLTKLSPLAVRPTAWDAPVLLEKRAAMDCTRIPRAPEPVEGVSVTLQDNSAEAENFLVAHSGKPTDGMYSKLIDC